MTFQDAVVHFFRTKILKGKNKQIPVKWLKIVILVCFVYTNRVSDDVKKASFEEDKKLGKTVSMDILHFSQNV